MGREDMKRAVSEKMMQRRRGDRQKTITRLVAVSVLGGARVGNDPPQSYDSNTNDSGGGPGRQYEEFIC